MCLGYVKDVKKCECGVDIDKLEVVESSDMFELLECPNCKRHYVIEKNPFITREFDAIYEGNWIEILEELILDKVR